MAVTNPGGGGAGEWLAAANNAGTIEGPAGFKVSRFESGGASIRLRGRITLSVELAAKGLLLAPNALHKPKEEKFITLTTITGVVLDCRVKTNGEIQCEAGIPANTVKLDGVSYDAT
jgi:hypothetical protein